MAQIFISYRRDDSAYPVATLSERLKRRFGDGSVFRDIDNIPLGIDFRAHIGNAVGQCDVLLAVIGNDWLTIPGKNGLPRLQDPRDPVRVEIESALARDILVVPVLVDKAEMPAEADLPESLRKLADRNGAEVRAGRDMDSQVARLVEGLEQAFAHLGKGIGLAPSVQAPTSSSPAVPAARRTEPDASAQLAAIRSAMTGYNERNLYIAPAIPEKKLRNVVRGYGNGLDVGDVLVLFDNTVFGAADDGFCLTRRGICWHNFLDDVGSIDYADIVSIGAMEVDSSWTLRVNGRTIIINMADDKTTLTDRTIAAVEALRQLG